MIKYILGVFVVAVVAALALVYLVPETPAPAITESEPSGISCYETDTHIVVVRDKVEAVGQDMLIKKKAAPQDALPCAYTPQAGDIELSGPDAADYFLAAEGEFLLIDSGTAPPPRGLTVLNMNTGDVLYTDQYNRPLDVADGSVTYWQPVDTVPTAQNCPDLAQLQSNGLGAGIERHVSLSLDGMELTDLGEERCSARQ